MAVSIDKVYQKVLAFANKEQRGYITPQEFNLFADQAQIEIFEQYFYDLNQAGRLPGNENVHVDSADVLENKMQIFEKVDYVNFSQNLINYTPAYNNDGSLTHPENHKVVETTIGYTRRYSSPPISLTQSAPDADNSAFVDMEYKLPDYIYKVHSIFYGGGQGGYSRYEEVEILNANDFDAIARDYAPKLLKPSLNPMFIKAIANVRDNHLRLTVDRGFEKRPNKIVYYKKPAAVNWGYVVVNDKALYNSTTSIDFELHQSEESELVYRILAFAGIAMQKPNLTQMAVGLETAKVQQEKQ
jgi:hypothetical protein